MKRVFICIALLLGLSLHTAFAERPMRILVHPFQNDGAAAHAWLAAGMTDSVVADLARISSVTVISQADRKKALAEIEFALSDAAAGAAAVRVGKLTGADAIFTGGYTVTGGTVRVVAKLIQVESGQVLKAVKLDGRLKDLRGLEDDIVFTLLGEALAVKAADVSAPAVTAADKAAVASRERPALDAYEAYAQGLTLQDADPEAALRLFERALSLNPKYLDALLEAGATAGGALGRSEAGLGYLRKAEEILSARRDTAGEEYAYLTQSFGAIHEGRGDSDRALEYYGKAAGILEKLNQQETADYADLLSSIGSAWEEKGDPKRALDSYAKAQGLLERLGLGRTLEYANILAALGSAEAALEKPDRALDYFSRARALMDALGVPVSADYAGLLACIGAARADKEEYRPALETLLQARALMDRLKLGNTVDYAYLLSDLAWMYQETGNDDAAGELFRRTYDLCVKLDYQGELKKEALENARRLGH